MLIPHSLSSGLRGLLLLAVCALAMPTHAAVPGQVDFQGLLLDAGGQKVNGAVDLVFTLYDAPTDGNALWTESHSDVPVSDGVYGVTLGTTTPLTQTQLAGGSVFLEISVEGETLSPRRQLLAVPYAVRAEMAENADNLGGASSAYFTEILDKISYDGGAPDNRDPREGTTDVDSDDLANFMDSDNDGDGILDTAELAQGTDINLVTPLITSFDPPLAFPDEPQTITVFGQHFEPGMSVAFGTDNPVPTNVTATSFQVTVAPQPSSIANVMVTRLNGESDAATYQFRNLKVFLGGAVFPNLGVAGADSRCAQTALTLGLTGTFLAWISDSSTSPAARFLQSTRPYERPDGTKIADDWADLTDGSLDAAFTPTPVAPVWTGTAADGTPVGGNCSNWTSASGATSGRTGIATSVTSQWSDSGSDTVCSGNGRLYCFEQR